MLGDGTKLSGCNVVFLRKADCDVESTVHRFICTIQQAYRQVQHFFAATEEDAPFVTSLRAWGPSVGCTPSVTTAEAAA